MIRKISLFFLSIYFIGSLPITAAFVVNEYFRFQFLQVLSNLYSKFDDLDYVFIGDSITAGGRNWGGLIDKPTYETINLAGNGYTTRQIVSQALNAKEYNPKYLFVMAGTNDVFTIRNGEYSMDNFIDNYEHLVEVTKKGNYKPIFTLIPYQASLKNKSLIDSMNSGIKKILRTSNLKYIDLNSEISEDGILLEEYTVDGVHFSSKANEIWGRELRKIIE